MLIILLLLGSKSALACWGRGGAIDIETFYDWDHEPTGAPEPGESKETPPTVGHIKDIIDRNKGIVWGGWTPPPDVVKDWRGWLHDYQLKTNKTDEPNDENRDRLKKEREEDGNWPDKWMNLGEGIGGIEPPPWGYSPKFTGKPEACNQSPRRGTCKATNTRWGWNPYLDKCMSYTWSGCGGSLNNFQSKLKCEEMCAMPPPPSCSVDSGIPAEEEE